MTGRRDISAEVRDSKTDAPADEATTRATLEAAGLTVTETLGGGLAYLHDTPALKRQLERPNDPHFFQWGTWTVGLQFEEA